jgi:hypothetical protein
MNYTDRIYPTHKGLTTYLDELIAKNYQIPTFQRDVVWDRFNVKKLWDSIYKFYPLGSILIWKTDLKLHNHRQIGGHTITDTNFTRTEYQYILDGQQRTTSLLTSLYGGVIDNQPGFDPTLYVDLTIPIQDETDDESFKDRFLFWSEIDDKNGTYKVNTPKKKRFDNGLIIKLIDIKNNFTNIQSKVFQNAEVNNDFNHHYLVELGKIKGVLDNYRISFIEIKGIQVSEVCQIFERINQAGKPLNIFDIIVAKTFRPKTNGNINDGFYLREIINEFRNQNRSEFMNLDDLDYLQIIAVIIKQNIQNSGVWNITERYLNEIKTDQIINVWDEAKIAILKTFDFLENHLHIKTPYLIPFRYFYFVLSSYFYNNSSPNYEFLKNYFWFYSFHNDDLLSNTTQLTNHLEFVNNEKHGKSISFERFYLDKQKLRNAKYSSKGRWSRAILSLFSSMQPKDWEHCDRDVLVQNIFFSTDKPNLHHIFPTNSEYVLNYKNKNITNDTLMNIAYLTQITNLNISNKNPLDYVKEFDKQGFEKILPTHLLGQEILEWGKSGIMPDDGLEIFIETRITNIINTLKERINITTLDIIDTIQNEEKT